MAVTDLDIIVYLTTYIGTTFLLMLLMFVLSYLF